GIHSDQRAIVQHRDRDARHARLELLLVNGQAPSPDGLKLSCQLRVVNIVCGVTGRSGRRVRWRSRRSIGAKARRALLVAARVRVAGVCALPAATKHRPHAGAEDPAERLERAPAALHALRLAHPAMPATGACTASAIAVLRSLKLC